MLLHLVIHMRQQQNICAFVHASKSCIHSAANAISSTLLSREVQQYATHGQCGTTWFQQLCLSKLTDVAKHCALHQLQQISITCDSQQCQISHIISVTWPKTPKVLALT